MRAKWDDFLKAIGGIEDSPAFRALILGIGEDPVRSETLAGYNDPLGETKFFKFMRSGIEVGYRQARLNHIHLFLKGIDGYSAYHGPLPEGIKEGQTMASLIGALGAPSSSGGGTESKLLGYRPKWARYDLDTYSIRFAFSSEDKLNQVSIIDRQA